MESHHNLRTRSNTIRCKEATNKTSNKQIGKNVKDNTDVHRKITLPKSTLVRTSLTKRTSTTPRPPNLSSNTTAVATSFGSRPSTGNKTTPSNFNSNFNSINRTSTAGKPPITPSSATHSFKQELTRFGSKLAEIEEWYIQLKSDNESLQITTALLSNLEVNFAETEEHCRILKVENQSLRESINNLRNEVSDLKQTQNSPTSELQELNQLKQEVSELKYQLQSFKETQTLVEKGVSIDQQELNSNIIIRGIDLTDNVNQTDLTDAYNKIRLNLGISAVDDFAPVSISILQPKTTKINSTASGSKPSTSRTIKVQLRSILAKRQLLQIKRTRKSINPSDIGINQKSKKSILIAEQLTAQNQELLYNARSLRTACNVKFVWSNNGQILLRQRPGAKVIRIRDNSHINQLKAEFSTQSNENGRLLTSENIITDSSHTQA